MEREELTVVFRTQPEQHSIHTVQHEEPENLAHIAADAAKSYERTQERRGPF